MLQPCDDQPLRAAEALRSATGTVAATYFNLVSLRGAAKAILERILMASPVATIARSRRSQRVLVLAYHNVVPDEFVPLGDLPNHLPLSIFAAQLDALEETHDVVPLPEALKEPGSSSRPRLVITFDDAYLGAVRYGIAELARRGLPAAIFVAPRFVGGRSFWWDALADPTAEGLDMRLRRIALKELRGEDEAVRAWARQNGVEEMTVPPLACAAPEKDLRDAAALPGISIGSHTWSHPNLTRLEPEQLRSELTLPLEWLKERFDCVIPWIAYPYGCFDERVARAAAAVGYVGGLGISGGWIPKGTKDALSLPRLNIPPGLSVDGFMLRASGIGA